jgi:flavin prenyltransferase
MFFWLFALSNCLTATDSKNLLSWSLHGTNMGKRRTDTKGPVTIVAVTGATGAVYADRLMEVLPGRRLLIITEHGKEVVGMELQGGLKALVSKADRVLNNDDLAANISSGAGVARQMVIVPCSMNTLSKIASGIADNLVTRAASVCLKEGWKLVIVPREAPLSLIHIENMARLKRAGAVILPASPGFYSRPKTVQDLVDFVVGRILNALGFEKEAIVTMKTWNGPKKS